MISLYRAAVGRAVSRWEVVEMMVLEIMPRSSNKKLRASHLHMVFDRQDHFLLMERRSLEWTLRNTTFCG